MRFLNANPVIFACIAVAWITSCMADEPRRPLIVAHRGLLQHAPENTLANFRACLELRIGFEFDVEKTRDGVLVCIHDSTVDRTTNGSGIVRELSFKEVRDLDAGKWFDPLFAGQKIPTVEEVFTLLADFRQHEVLVAVDLKAEKVEGEVARLAEKLGVIDRLIFIGRTISEESVRDNIKRACPKAHCAALANQPAEFPQALRKENADWVYVRYVPTQTEVAAARQIGKRVFIAGLTVAGKEIENWKNANRVGLDAILTDYPFDLRMTLK